MREKGVGQGGEERERGNRARVSCAYIIGPVDGINTLLCTFVCDFPRDLEVEAKRLRHFAVELELRHVQLARTSAGLQVRQV